MKQMRTIFLKGTINGVTAKAHQGDDVRIFTAPGPKGTPGYFTVDNSIEGTPVLITPKGRYQLVWSRSGQYFEPKEDISGVKIHVTLKPITGKLIYWACLSPGNRIGKPNNHSVRKHL